MTYRLEMKLGDYIARREQDIIARREQDIIARRQDDLAKKANPCPVAMPYLGESLGAPETHNFITGENKMSTTDNLECKVETKDIVEFQEGKAPKFDKNKVRMDLLPIRPLKDVATVLTYGLDKYGKDSWRKGEMISWGRCYSALQRHLFAFQSGEDLDPETGESHLAHAACNLLMLIEHTYVNPQGDDRLKGAPYSDK